MKRMEQASNIGIVDPVYRGIYKAGAVAALVAAVLFRRNMDAEWMLLRGLGMVHSGPAAPPNSVLEWFSLLEHNRLLGLIFLNLFDLVNYALLGVMLLALWAALRKTRPGGMLMAAALGLAGVVVYFASNQAFSMLALSKQYEAATSAVQRETLLAAGQALLVVHQNASFAGSGFYLSFLLVSVAGLMISFVMLDSSIFSKGTAVMGMLANGFGLGYYLVLVFAPELVFVPLSISAVFLLIWYLQIGGRLWRLGVRGVEVPGWSGALHLEQVPRREEKTASVPSQ